MEVQRASPEDLPAVLALRDEAARWRPDGAIDPWRPPARSPDEVPSWLDDLHVGYVDGELAGCVAVGDAHPEVWSDAPAVGGRAGYVHRLLVARAFAERGPGDGLLGWAERELVRTGHDLARLAVAATDDASQRWYADRGYVAWDTVAVPGRAPVVRREKALVDAGPPGARPRGPRELTRFQDAVATVVAAIAPGEVATYAEVAEEAGHPGSAQAVANVLRGVPGLPWWRVVPTDGRIYRTHASRQVPRLRAEGVAVGDDRRVGG